MAGETIPPPQPRKVESPLRPNLLTETAFHSAYKNGNQLLSEATNKQVRNPSLDNINSTLPYIIDAQKAQAGGGKFLKEIPSTDTSEAKKIEVTGSFDEDNGEWRVNYGMRENKGFIDQLEPSRIHALEDIAVTDNPAVDQAQKDIANKIAADLKNSLEVTDGQETISYEEWWKRAETRAQEDAKAAGKPDNYKPTREEVLTAEKKLIEEKGAHFGYVCITATQTNEAPPDEAPDPKEPPWLKELNAEQKTVYHMATTVGREAIDALQTLQEQDPSAKIGDDAALTTLGILTDALGQAKSVQSRRFLLAGIYSYLKNPTITTHLPDATKTRLQTFLKDKKIMKKHNSLMGELLTNVISPALEAGFPSEWRYIVQELRTNQEDLNNLFGYIGIAARLHGLPPGDIDTNIMQFRKDGRSFSTAAINLIKSLSVKGEGMQIFESTLTAMGLDYKDMKDLKSYARANSGRIVSAIEGTRQKPADWEERVKPLRMRVFEKISDIDEEKLVKKFKVNPKFLLSLGGAAMIITMFQNTLGFGVFAEEQQQGGHGG